MSCYVYDLKIIKPDKYRPNESIYYTCHCIVIALNIVEIYLGEHPRLQTKDDVKMSNQNKKQNQKVWWNIGGADDNKSKDG